MNTVLCPTHNQLIQGFSKTHRGYDFESVLLSNKVRACMDGVVTVCVSGFASCWDSNGRWVERDYGNYVKIKHTDGTHSLYAHLGLIDVSLGDDVKRGDVIAHMGNTGRSMKRHLHFEYRNNNHKHIQVAFTAS